MTDWNYVLVNCCYVWPLFLQMITTKEARVRDWMDLMFAEIHHSEFVKPENTSPKALNILKCVVINVTILS